MTNQAIPDLDQQSLDLHRKHNGKLATALKVPLGDTRDLSLACTPGVAAVCEAIHRDPPRT